MSELKKPTISLSMIAKNEEEMIEACLKSVDGVDEIIVVDTGSEDKTVEIAKKYGKVFTDYKWNDNFSEARNIAHSRCIGDWILILDCDEELAVPVEKLRNLLEQPFMKNRDTVMLKVDTGMEVNNQFRLHRNKSDIQWVGAAHNLLRYVENGKSMPIPEEKIHFSDFKVKSGFSPAHKKDPDRTLRIMTKGLQADPGNTRYMYYIAREWLNRKQVFHAIYYLEKYVKIAEPTNELADAEFLLGSCYMDMGDLNNAVDHFLQSIKHLPDFKAPWVQLHNMTHPDYKPLFKKIAQSVKNKGVLFTRENAEMFLDPSQAKYIDSKQNKK